MTRFRSSAAYRIAFTYSAAFALAILLLGTAVYLAADREFRHQRDLAIGEEAADLARGRDPRAIAGEIAERERIRSGAPDSFIYALFGPRGTRLAGSLATSAPPSPGMGWQLFQDPVEGPDMARIQTLVLAGGYRLTVGVDSEPVERIDATILALFGLAFTVVVVLGILGALLLGGYLRRRLSSISGTAAVIVAGSLDRRVPIGARGDEFDQVGAAVNAMLDRIAHLMDNLRQVSSDVAHDLRTPLMRLRNQLEQVGRVEGAVERSIEQADSLLALFAAILRIAEVECGGMALAKAPLDLSQLAIDVAEAYQPALLDSGHRLAWSIAPDVSVAGDRELLAQVMANLLDNSRVHTPAGTDVRLSLDADPHTARISVADDGPGVQALDRERILRRFARGEASRSTPGHGLGLSLVRAIAAAHGGHVDVADASPGLLVTVKLPRLPH